MTIAVKVSTLAEQDEDDAATLRDAADVLRRHADAEQADTLEALADLLDGPID